MYKSPSAVQNSKSPESAEPAPLLRNIVDVSLKKLVVNWWSNQSEEKDRKEDRRRLAFSGDKIFCMETGRGRRSVVVSGKVVLGVKLVKEGVSSTVWDAVSDDCLRPRFVNARNPDLKKSE